MIINNGSALQRHDRTGRPLNLWANDQKVSCEVLHSSYLKKQIKAVKIGQAVAVLYKAQHKRSTYKACGIVESFCVWLALNPSKVLEINHNAVKLSEHALKKVIDNLEAMEVIEVFQGFPHANGARPKAIKATEKLLNLIE